MAVAGITTTKARTQQSNCRSVCQSVMGGAASIELSPCLESWKAEAAKEPDDFTDLLTEEALKGEISRLRREIRKQVNMIVSKDDNNLVLDQEINSLLDRAHTVEEWLTPILQNIASLHEECELTGLQFKFKSFHSLKRKVQGVLKTKERQMARNKSKGGGLDIAASVNAVSDALRYTLLVPASSYTETVATLRQTLQESNFSPYHMKNYWSEGDMYQGINDVFTEMDSKLKVEIQYHTPESWQLKSSAHVSHCPFYNMLGYIILYHYSILFCWNCLFSSMFEFMSAYTELCNILFCFCFHVWCTYRLFMRNFAFVRSPWNNKNCSQKESLWPPHYPFPEESWTYRI
jgi:hypothetical protein